MGEDQQALLAEFERRRRVSIDISHSSFIIYELESTCAYTASRLGKFMSQLMMSK